VEGELEAQRERIEGWIEVVEAHLEAIQEFRGAKGRQEVVEEDVEYMGVLNQGMASTLQQRKLLRR
jgi:hypothetical protein